MVQLGLEDGTNMRGNPCMYWFEDGLINWSIVWVPEWDPRFKLSTFELATAMAKELGIKQFILSEGRSIVSATGISHQV